MGTKTTWLASPITDVTAVLVYKWNVCPELAFAWYQFSGGHHDFSKQLVISLYHGVVTVAYRRRVRQCHAAAAALLWVIGRREAGLLVMLRHLHLRYAVTRGLICAAKPSSPPRVPLTLYRPFRTILQQRDCLLHVRYRDGARVTDILAFLCSTLSEPSGNKTDPSRSHQVRSLTGPDRLRTLARSSAYAPTTRTVRMPLTAPAVPSSSVDEVQSASCCWCRRRPAGVTAEITAVGETTAVDQKPQQ